MPIIMVERKGSRRLFLKATGAVAGAILTCAAGKGDRYEQEPEFRLPAQDQSRPVEKPRIFTEQEVRVIIETKAGEIGVPKEKAKAIAWCESKNKQFAKNDSGASGIFQIMPGTWQDILNKILPHRINMNIWDAEDNIDAALALWKKEGSKPWVQCGG